MQEDAFLVAAPDANATDMKELLQHSIDIQSWWNHMPGVYLVMTSIEPGALAELLRLAAGDTSLMVAKIDLASTEGWLPQPAWDWIRKREKLSANNHHLA